MRIVTQLACMALLYIIGGLFLYRFLYWMQLDEKIGPNVINVSRCVNDIITIGIAYVIICVAYSCGLVYILKVNRDTHPQNTTDTNESDTKELTIDDIDSALDSLDDRVCGLRNSLRKSVEDHVLPTPASRSTSPPSRSMARGPVRKRKF